ncbi:MAG: cytochrome c [Magnetococcales bacterium]|nr:cytochrome c [Magnetococcales bacterium]
MASMDANSSFSRRWLDSYLTEHNLAGHVRYLSAKQLEELRMVSNIYRTVATSYLSEEKFAFYFRNIISFTLFTYKSNKMVCSVQDDDLFWYFTWMYRKGYNKDDILSSADCVVDFFHILLQEGIIRYNPLFKVYKMFLARDTVLSTMKMESIILKFESGNNSNNSETSDRLLDQAEKLLDQDIPPPPTSDIHQDNHTNAPRPYITKQKTLLKILLFIVFILLTGYLFNNMDEWNSKEQITATKKRSEKQAIQQNNKLDIKIKYFYENNMKHYYCKNYLNIPCDKSTLTTNPVSAELENILSGWQYYNEFCVRCHGDNGRGNGSDAHLLKTQLPTLGWAGSNLLERDAFLFWIIAEGGNDFGGEMPRFKEVLTQEKIWKIIIFIKTLR